MIVLMKLYILGKFFIISTGIHIEYYEVPDFRNDRLQYQFYVAREYEIKNFNKEQYFIEMFVHESLATEYYGNLWGFSHAERLLWAKRTLRAIERETAYGGAGTGQKYNNLVGMKYPMNYMNFCSYKANQNNAGYSYWSYSILTAYEYYIKHRCYWIE